MGIINGFSSFLWTYVLIILLVGLGIYFTFASKFVQIPHLREMFVLLTDSQAIISKEF